MGNASVDTAKKYPLSRVLAAWGVHAFTMTGVVWACLATLAIMEQNYRMMWLWLGIALIVDGLDGSMARKAEVSKVIPWFYGSTLDIIVDYLTWTFIPVIFIYKQIPLGPQWVAGVLMVLIAASSMFCYCNQYEKSSDNYFVGFPAAWNIVAFYLWILEQPVWFNVGAILVLVIMTLVPTAYVHPFRVKKLMTVNILMTVVWFVSVISFVITSPEKYVWQWVLFAVGSAWYMLVGFWRTFISKDPYGEAPSEYGNCACK